MSEQRQQLPTTIATITVENYDQRFRKETAYAVKHRAGGGFNVLLTDQGITISNKEKPLTPHLFDGQYMLCFSSLVEARWFIDTFLGKPNLFERIIGRLVALWTWRRQADQDQVEQQQEEHLA